MGAFTSNGYHFHSLLREVHKFFYLTHAFFVCGWGGGYSAARLVEAPRYKPEGR